MAQISSTSAWALRCLSSAGSVHQTAVPTAATIATAKVRITVKERRFASFWAIFDKTSNYLGELPQALVLLPAWRWNPRQ